MVLLSHKGASTFKNKIFTLYKDLCIVYAKDYAIGKDVQISMDMCEEILHEKDNENNIGQNEKDGLEEFNEDMVCT
jgi:hypothetical protein